jgi:hypothetical protein
MKLFGSRVFWGVLLILGGLALLLENLGIFRVGGLIWGIILGVGGLVFLTVYLENRAAWWPLIPGITLLSICAAALIEAVFPSLGELINGAVVLGGIGLSFFIVYLVNRENWWAIIPAGVLVTLGIISTIEAGDFDVDTGGYFFLGMGLTFLLVAILPTPQGQMKWALIPAVILLVMGVLITAAVQDILNFIWPVIIILGGGYLIIKAFASGRSRR